MATAGLCNSTYHPGSLDGSCGEDGGRNVDWAGLLLVFFGVVLTGVGNCCYYMFGVPYLDDNTKHENAPFMLGAVYTFRGGITKFYLDLNFTFFFVCSLKFRTFCRLFFLKEC